MLDCSYSYSYCSTRSFPCPLLAADVVDLWCAHRTRTRYGSDRKSQRCRPAARASRKTCTADESSLNIDIRTIVGHGLPLGCKYTSRILNMAAPLKICLVGPPQTGKTFLSKILAEQSLADEPEYNPTAGVR